MHEQDQIKNQWTNLCSSYGAPVSLIEKSFQEIMKAYGSKNRHYHNLGHIRALLQSADEHKALIEDYDAVLFAIFMHDIVYKATASGNEEQSAALSERLLKDLYIPEEKILMISEMILATKDHTTLPDDAGTDLKIFLDFDLKILGEDRDVYQQYMKQIRREYALVPDFLYNPGRKKVLKKFMQARFLYKTKVFRDLYEMKARENIQFEIDQL